MGQGTGRPDPFFDDGGFPFVLRPIRNLALGRGGRLEGTGFSWRIVPPLPALPTVRTTFE